MATPHNAANMGDIAETILLPGDPLRAKVIAETFLENPVQFNTVRICLDTPEHIKERKYLSWELEWVCRLLAFTAMN